MILNFQDKKISAELGSVGCIDFRGGSCRRGEAFCPSEHTELVLHVVSFPVFSSLQQSLELRELHSHGMAVLYYPIQ